MMKRLTVLALLALGAGPALAADTSADQQALRTAVEKAEPGAKAQPCPCAGAHR